jgi:FMN phosphatase YigB (HAD superfamily)
MRLATLKDVASLHDVKIVSFDLEGTLVTPDFSDAVWHEGIPSLYASQKGVSRCEAKRTVFTEYDRVGDLGSEWYDIKYWFSFFGLGDYREVLEKCRMYVVRPSETSRQFWE